MSAADTLRRASETLREVVGKLTTDTDRWDESFPVSNVYGDHSTYERVIIHPTFALLVADWLEATAADEAWCCEDCRVRQNPDQRAALALAEHINERTSQ